MVVVMLLNDCQCLLKIDTEQQSSTLIVQSGILTSDIHQAVYIFLYLCAVVLFLRSLNLVISHHMVNNPDIHKWVTFYNPALLINESRI